VFKEIIYRSSNYFKQLKIGPTAVSFDPPITIGTFYLFKIIEVFIVNFWSSYSKGVF